jgi:hypothetical protein
MCVGKRRTKYGLSMRITSRVGNDSICFGKWGYKTGKQDKTDGAMSE